MQPPPPPEQPIIQLKRYNTAPELKTELEKLKLSQRGTKSDLCLRLVKHKSGILMLDEIFHEFTVKQLQSRLREKNITFHSNHTKRQLAELYLDVIT